MVYLVEEECKLYIPLLSLGDQLKWLYPKSVNEGPRGPIPPSTRSPQSWHTAALASSQPRAPGFSSWPFSGPGASKVAVATGWSLSRFPSAQQSSPDRRGGGGGGSERPRPLPREGAARPWAAGAASALLHRWLGAPLRSAGLGSGPRARLAAFPFSSAAAPWAASPSKTRVRSSVPAFTDFRERRILPRSLRASLGLSPPPLATPPPRARAHARVPPAAESPAPLSRSRLSQAPLLTQASSRHGASSVCCSGGDGGGGGSGGNAAPGPAASLGRPGSEPGSCGLAPARAPGSRLGEEWARGEGSGARGEAGKEGCVDAWGLRCSPHTLPRCALAQAPSLLLARGCPAPQTAVLRSPSRPPASVGSGLRARRAPVTSPAPWTAHPAPVAPSGRRPGDPVLPAQCSRCPLLSRLSPSRPASLLLQRWRTPLCCGPETFLPAWSALGTIVVICDCPLSRGARTPWTGLTRRERAQPGPARGKGGTEAAGLGRC
ncbi:translation initiation factor IF-2-like [Cebus imitator]|uniref:translation initiation factor IF-2-like n=1 Tax=Cebus imitator TaxID=2715852 RepID=UPI00189714DD|nr:translation initiation factor IF-2-like [Cebus imitator]